MAAALCGEEEEAWRAYIEASLRLETMLDDALRAEAGLSMIDYHLLLLLSEASQGRLRMSELADRMVFSRSRITYQVNSMAKRGLVVREQAPDDRRGFRAVLTATGSEALRAAAPKHAAAVRELFLDAMHGDELACVGSIFGRIRARLESDMKETP